MKKLIPNSKSKNPIMVASWEELDKINDMYKREKKVKLLLR